MLSAMFWPLIGGFIAFVLLAVLLGWIMDTSRHDRAGEPGDGQDGH
jgi:ABC-type Mn2+/Zn2+ transport system permease subunit